MTHWYYRSKRYWKMLKRINWKAVFYGFCWTASLGGIIALMSFIEVKKSEAKCTDIKVSIPGIESFIDRQEIDEIIMHNTGDLVGRKLNTIDIHKLENALKANPYIRFAKVYADMDGVISVQIKQREPVLRIINVAGQDFYVDSEGLKMPVSPSFTPHVVVANGFILEGFSGRVDTLQTKMGKDIFKTASFIQKDSLWIEQIEQLFVNDKREIEMVPRVGDQRIILGDADSLDIKFRNLLVFYKKAMPTVGWDAYKTINIKYINQIVCEKRDADEGIHTNSAPGTSQVVRDTTKIIQDTLKTATH